MDEKQRCGACADGSGNSEIAASAAAAFRRIEDMIRQRIPVRHLFGVGRRNRDELLPPQDTKTCAKAVQSRRDFCRKFPGERYRRTDRHALPSVPSCQ